MKKTRISNLAEKLGIEVKELLSRLRELGYDVKTAASSVDDEAVAKLTVDNTGEPKTEQVRVTSRIVRRRARVASEDMDEPRLDEPDAEQTAAAEKYVEQEKPDKVVPVVPERVLVVRTASEEIPEPVEVQVDPQSIVPEPEEKPVSEKPVETDKPVEPVSEKPKPHKEQPARASATQARILGMVEIPISPEPRTERRDSGRGQRPSSVGNDRRPPRPAPEAAQRQARQETARPAEVAPVEVPVPVDDRRKMAAPGRKAGVKDQAGEKAKKGAKGKGREQFSKQALLEREERQFDPVHKSRKRQKEREQSNKTEITTPKAIKRVIKISETITVGDLAKRMGVKATDLIKTMMKMGSMVTINYVLDLDSASLLASEYGYEVENVAVDLDLILESTEDAPELLKPRPPVVTIMGHVDHGKTSLLDAIREANVISGEAGGITQHIGAYYVELHGRKITFLDTPGHESFTAMRARGAKVTDIVILVVAADDGVMPQTREAINHAKAAEVPIIVAINKIDKPEAKPERVKQELTEYGLVASDWGGDTTMVEVSAKKRLNLEELLEMVLLQADLMDLLANPDKEAKGTIVEGKLDKGRGPVATVLVQEGTLKTGDYCVVGIHSGRVRAMQSDRGERLSEAGPSMPVELVGLSGVPDAGDIFVAMKDERQAKEIATLRQIKQRELELAKHAKMSLEQLYEKIQKGEVKDLNVIVKADVQGTAEAVSDSLRKLSTDAVRLNVIHTAVGAVTETDVNLATASNAIIIGFNIRPEVKAQAMAEKERVDIRLYSVIYNAIDDVKKAMEGLLEPVYKEKYLGRAQIREVFSVPKAGNVAGCYVQDGKIVRNANVRLLRDNVVIYEGKLSSLRRFKDDVKEVSTGYECGMGLENYNDIKQDDIIEAYEMEQIAAKL